MAEWQRAMSSREFAEWAAYAQIEPFGPVRADLRIAMLTALIAETARDRDKRAEPYGPADFMPFMDLDVAPAPAGEHAHPDPAAVFAKLKTGLGLTKKEKRQDGGSK